ncbi:RusA family crossover junction endodeoxyribonuclease [Parvularcula sp. IMCC14364]|uniref:RusA family crossover junction endodeoxyribonuclease n=1 Tax=Parvularcula sp. IMCC14364 TaxID=3067902 RepID=UPI0027427285|nr:RusA family crossover junction endodeoxyribonuclease [Parvularcula sp. IMCC14364]
MRSTGFRGKGKVQIAFRGDTALLRIDAATTQTRRLKKLVADFCRREVASRRPWFGPFEVHIWTSVRDDKRGAHDVDNIAKACLDALNGVFWRDDRQVVRLTSEKFIGDVNQIAILVRPLDGAPESHELDENLFDL